MNRTTLKRVGAWAGYLIVPLFIASAISLLTFGQFSPLIVGFLIALAVCLILFTATNPELVGQAFRTRAVRNGVTTLIIAISVAGIVVLVNVLAARATVRVDTTQNQLYTLTDATIKTLEKIKDPVKVTILYSRNTTSQRDQAIDLINEYKARNDKISYQAYDVESLDGLGKLRELNVNTDDLAVFQQGSRRADATSMDEQSFTRALVQLNQQVARRVFFITGHGERATTASSSANQANSMSSAASALTQNNYKVDTYNLQTGVGGDGKPVQLNPATDILIFAGPTAPYRPEEISAATKFLQQGGRGMFLYDPSSLFSQNNQRSNLNDILKQWNGLSFTEGVLLELDPRYARSESPTILLPNLVDSASDIVRGITYQVQFPISAAVDQGQNQSGFTALFSSSSNSYLKTDPQQVTQQQFQFDAAKDKRGPLVVAASFETDAKEPAPGATPAANATPGATPTANPANTGKTRMVLFAGVEFAADNQQVGLSGSPGNYNLFVNSVNWLADAGDAVVISPKQPNNVPFTISKSQDTFIYYSAVFGLPIIVFFIGLVVWWRRR